MQQTVLTIIAPVDPKRLEPPASWAASRERLAQLQLQLSAARDRSGAGEIAAELRALLAPGEFAASGGIHCLSFFAIDAAEEGPAYLVLELNFDGSTTAMLQRLVARAPQFLLQLFADCAELDTGASALPAFLRRHARAPDAVYVAFPGRTVGQIQAEQRLRREVRERFEAADSSRPSGVCPRAGGATSLRLSPTSASAMWRTLRDAFAESPLVQARSARPLLVRWSLRGGWRDSLNRWGTRLGSVFGAAAALEGLRLLQQDARLEPLRTPLLACALALAICACLLVALVTLREAPRSLRLPGQWLVLRGLFGEQLSALFCVAATLGASALFGSIAQRLTALQLGVSALVLLLALVGLAAARLSPLALALGAGVSIAAARLPAELLPVIPAAALTLLCAGLMALLTAFSYVLVGRAAALLWPLICAAAAVAHFAYGARLHPLGAVDLLEASAIGALALACAVAFAALWVGSWLVAVRRAEHAEAAAEPNAHPSGRVDRDPEHLDTVQALEDRGVQNHLITVSRLKPGALRLRTLRRVLRGVLLGAKLYANRGDVAGIRTLHFASFQLLPDGKRLLFLANHDGGLDSYLREFSAVPGATAVWSNCVGFPPAYFLLGEGGRDQRRFQAFGRNDQVPTVGWYSAYPELSIRDIEAATQIREDLRRPLADPSSWTGRWQLRFGSPLREADCDLALRVGFPAE